MSIEAQALATRNSAFSPDIYGLQIAWDSTSLGTLKECPRKYQYSLIEGWQPRETSVHLWFGNLYHKALEGYDHARSWGHSHEEAQQYALFICLTQTWDFKKKRAISFDSPNKTRETLVRSVLWYLEQFGENDSCQTVQLANGKPAVELSFRIPLEHLAPTGQSYILCGHLDRLVTFQEQYYVLDRKTSGHQIDDRFFQSFSPSNQMQIYHLGGQLVLQSPTRGIIIDGAQIAVSFTRFKRGIIQYTSAQNEEFYQELGVWFGLAASFAEANFWPKNEKSCSNYGGCPFLSICSKPPSIREDWLKAAFFQRVWNPLVARGDI